ncbi:CAP domain-containing protein [Histomonas meleagridis]|uniref:CAP domain-containing protein n=1 Tax=Histomonas meleagridis TaxID=135588 RepID=UPI00355A3022|nr:CAP domain-containing protein [Histomonas meleagridis]KAH0796769.1 CAP domain-containing protein [Histomonas meleagridis]
MLFLLCSFGLSATVTWNELQSRSKSTICSKYNSLYKAKHTGSCHTASSSKCNIGKHAAQDYTDALNRLNFFRYLTGLSTLKKSTNSTLIKEQNQACLIMETNNVFSHSLSSSLSCYTKGGGLAASKSNIYWHSRAACASASINSYMNDNGVDSLGHRRWLLLPTLSELAVGVVGHYSALRVMQFPRTSTSSPKFIAYPPPGPVPSDLIYSYWSFSRQWNPKSQSAHNMPSDTKVSITCNGKSISVSQKLYTENTAMYSGIVKFKPARLPSVGEKFDVTIQSKSANTVWKYSVTAVSCASNEANEMDEEIEIEQNSELTTEGKITISTVVIVVGIAIIAFVAFLIIRKRSLKYIPL